MSKVGEIVAFVQAQESHPVARSVVLQRFGEEINGTALAVSIQVLSELGYVEKARGTGRTPMTEQEKIAAQIARLEKKLAAVAAAPAAE